MRMAEITLVSTGTEAENREALGMEPTPAVAEPEKPEAKAEEPKPKPARSGRSYDRRIDELTRQIAQQNEVILKLTNRLTVPEPEVKPNGSTVAGPLLKDYKTVEEFYDARRKYADKK